MHAFGQRRNYMAGSAKIMALPLWFALLLASYTLSFQILAYYVGGDQAHYRLFYERLADANFWDVPSLQLRAIGGAEPLYGYTMWIGAQLGVAKDVWVSFFNAVFVAAAVCFLRRNQASLLVILLLLTNFYFMVLLTSAERLKFSYLMLLAAALCTGRFRVLLAAVAPLYHFQSLINFSATAAGQLTNLRPSRRVRAGTLVAGIFLLLAASGVFVHYAPEILRKSMGYAERSGGFTELTNLAALLVIGTVATRRKGLFVASMLPVIFAAVTIGAMRVNMIGVVVLLLQVLTERRANHPLILILLAYFSYKSFGYIGDIISYGDGFAGLNIEAGR